MSQPDSKLVVWIRKQLASDIEEDGGITRFELWHSMSESAGGSRLAVFDARQDADDLAAEAWEAAEQDAGTRISSVPNRYVIASFRRDNDRDVAGQWSFLIKGGSEASRVMSMGDTFPATNAGERAHIMHEMSKNFELMFNMSRFMAESGQAELSRERAFRMKTEDRALEMYSKLEELTDRQHQRNLETAREEAKAKRHEQLMAMLMTFAPVALSTMAKGMGFSGTGAVRDFGIGQILKGLKEKEVMGVIAALDPEHQAAFLELYKSYAESAEKEQKEKHPLLRDAKPEPEAKASQDEPRHNIIRLARDKA